MHRNARAGAWTLRRDEKSCYARSMTGYRNARAGAWTLRQHVPEDGKPAVGGIAMPAQGLGRCDEPLDRKRALPSLIAMPAQELGRCDSLRTP